MRRRRRSLAGIQMVENRAKPRCFREFKRGDLLETCLESTKKATGLVYEFNIPYKQAVEKVATDCTKIKDVNTQVACITGATEVLMKSTGMPQTLDGRRRRRRR